MLQFWACHAFPWGSAYCMSQGQATRALLVVHQDSQVVCAAVHKYSHVIQTFTNLSLTAMIQLKPGIPPASLKGPHETRRDAEETRPIKKKKSGVHFERVFSDAAVAPFDQVEWERRTAEITDDGGKVIFKQEDVEVPKSWSPLATKIAVSKYFYGDIANGTDPYKGGRETFGPAADSSRDPHDRRLRNGGRLFRGCGSGGSFLRRADLALREPVRRLQLAGLVQRRPVSSIRHRQRRR